MTRILFLMTAFALPLAAQAPPVPAEPPKKPVLPKAIKPQAVQPKALQPKAAVKLPTPTKANVPYGDHPRQVMDFWQAKSDSPTPLVLYIHGGGWNNGDKNSVGSRVETFLKEGISVAAINYRMVPEATEKKIEPPVKWPLSDAARALQFIRSKASEWNIDKMKIGATGGSAGACSSLWLAFHDDLADPKSEDPVARESTRLYCAAVSGAQTTLDPKITREWMPNAKYGGHAFAVEGKYSDVKQFEAFHTKRDGLEKWINEYSPLNHVTKDDPPVFLEYPSQKKPPVKGEEQADPTHSALYGMILAEKTKPAGVQMILVYPGQTHEKYKNANEYLIGMLKK